MFKMLICTDKLGAIGKSNSLLYHYKADMKYFAKQTTNQVVVMGNNTYLSLQDLGMTNGLPNRKNIVISHTPHKSVFLQDEGTSYITSPSTLTTGLVGAYINNLR